MSAMEEAEAAWPTYRDTHPVNNTPEQRHAFIAGYFAARVVAEEPGGRRWFTAAYRAQNGNVIPIGSETVIRADAQATVDEFRREDEEGPEYFLASRVLPPWVPVKQGDEKP